MQRCIALADCIEWLGAGHSATWLWSGCMDILPVAFQIVEHLFRLQDFVNWSHFFSILLLLWYTQICSTWWVGTWHWWGSLEVLLLLHQFFASSSFLNWKRLFTSQFFFLCFCSYFLAMLQAFSLSFKTAHLDICFSSSASFCWFPFDSLNLSCFAFLCCWIFFLVFVVHCLVFLTLFSAFPNLFYAVFEYIHFYAKLNWSQVRLYGTKWVNRIFINNSIKPICLL